MFIFTGNLVVVAAVTADNINQERPQAYFLAGMLQVINFLKRVFLSLHRVSGG
jgi:hypothetical protein